MNKKATAKDNLLKSRKKKRMFCEHACHFDAQRGTEATSARQNEIFLAIFQHLILLATPSYPLLRFI